VVFYHYSCRSVRPYADTVLQYYIFSTYSCIHIRRCLSTYCGRTVALSEFAGKSFLVNFTLKKNVIENRGKNLTLGDMESNSLSPGVELFYYVFFFLSIFEFYRENV
jgi:hypothetical protein